MASILANMTVKIAANTAELVKGVSQSTAAIKQFTGDLKSMAGVAATAFSIREIADFSLEVNKLAGRFEGVQRAFDRLPNSTLLMEKLKTSTHGTVSELELMQQALRAKNFGISVKDLGTYLEFAAIRAQQTGESIDYMVNSIILGLGRGSIKILDNLQVNIAKIKETVKETGVSLQEAFRQQVIEQMQTIGGYAETSATQVERLEVAIKKLKLEAAQKLESGDFIKFIGEQVDALRLFIKAGGDPLKIKTVQILEDIENTAVKIAKRTTDTLTGTLQQQQDAVQQEINTLVEIIQKRNIELRKVQEELKKVGTGVGATDKREALINQQNSMGIDIRQMKRAKEILVEYLQTLKTGSQDVGKELGLIEKLRQDIQNEEEFLNAAKTEADVKVSVDALKKLNTELDRLLGKQKQAKALQLQFIPDLEAEGSTNPELRNEQAVNSAKELTAAIQETGYAALTAGQQIINLSTEAPKAMQEAADKMVEISGLIVGGIVDIADAFGQAAVTGAKEFGKNILRSMAGFAQQFGALLIATGIAAIQFKTFSGPGMIAAGAALVALGGAVRSSINNRPSLGSGGGRGGFNGGANTMSSFTRGGVELAVAGEWRIQGDDLVYIFNRANQKNGRTR